MNNSSKSIIKEVRAKKILNSKGKPTIEVEILTGFGRTNASVPSGTSKGKYEALEKEVEVAIGNINTVIAPKLKKREVSHQEEIDGFLIKLDGTKNKSRLGANAILAVSIAVCRAGAVAEKMALWKWIAEIAGTRPSLPNPSVLFFEGGLHGRGGFDIQEFMGFFPGKSFSEKFRKTAAAYNQLKEILKKRYGKETVKLGLEGAFTPRIKETREVLDLLMKASEKNKIKIIIDAAASSFFKKEKYFFEGRKLDRKKLLKIYLELFRKYPILAIEDPFAEDDWQGWKELNAKMTLRGASRKMKNEKFLIIGDDLTVTNPERIVWAHRKKLCNGVIIKPNQIGTVTETIRAVKLAKSYGWKTMVSHRSGETMDDFIADLAVGLGADFIKSGAPSKPERMVKYNRLLEIEKEFKKYEQINIIKTF